MSLSRPFFNSQSARTAMPLFAPIVTDEEYRQMHWTRQLEVRPLRNRTPYRNSMEIDYDNRLDNFDIDWEKDSEPQDN